MIVDGFGIPHPTENDPITTENLLHIGGCAKCQGTFEPGAVAYATAIQGIFERTAAALADRKANDPQ